MIQSRLKFLVEAEYRFIKTKKLCPSEQGVTLIETLAALVIFLIILGFMIPIFTNQRLKTIQNEIQTGAVAVSQQILDLLRQSDIATLPNSGATTTLPVGTSLPNGSTTTTSIPQMGKTYSASIIYCPDAPTDIYCNSNARRIKVQVNYNGQTVYTVETVYTRLQ